MTLVEKLTEVEYPVDTGDERLSDRGNWKLRAALDIRERFGDVLPSSLKKKLALDIAKRQGESKLNGRQAAL